jgi:hypothetical protein
MVVVIGIGESMGYDQTLVDTVERDGQAINHGPEFMQLTP